MNHGVPMIESFKNVMVRSGAGWVLYLLIALSVVSIAIAIDRAYAFWSRRDDVPRLMRELHRLLETEDLKKALALLEASSSVEASVVAAGLALWSHGPAAVKEAMAAATGRERATLEQRLGFLGTIGNNAPFVGLLGTVIGVVGAFEAMGHGAGPEASGALAPELVMSNIAEALVATAVGLVVAIPAVALFNYFQGALTATIESAETLGHVLLSHVEGEVQAARPPPSLREAKRGAA
jgi:biopolymer transport protein ExbB